MNDCQCIIPNGGYCERHKCRKGPRLVRLCQTDAAYFAKWEAGNGPGQKPPTTDRTFPPITAQAWNLATALAAFVVNPGLVDATTYQTRLETCEACPERAGHRCTACGCFVHLKAKAKAWGCPRGKWLAIEKPKPCGCGRRKITA